MKIVKKSNQINTFCNNNYKKIGFVPTLGSLHAGHLSLIKKAKKQNFNNFKKTEFNEKMFGVSKDNTILKVINNKTHEGCKYYMVYVDVGRYSDTGLNQGAHMWTIKLRARNWKSKYVPQYCGRRIGIVTNQNHMDCSESDANLFKTGYDFMIDEPYHASEKEWKIDGEVTIKLNCNTGKVTYYLDGRMRKIQYADINAEKKYYIGLSCCATHNHLYYQIVESPYEMFLYC